MLNVNPSTIFCRDNIEVLRGVNSGRIDLIYLDPPFNKKKTFTAAAGSAAEGAFFKDMFGEEDVKEEWTQTISRDNPALRDLLSAVKAFSSECNYCYCVYMSVRIMECRRVLKETGNVFLHCDPTMSHYLKLVMDCVFGESNFRNEIAWCYAGPAKTLTRFTRKHDVILFYAKSDLSCFNADAVRVRHKRQTVSGGRGMAAGDRTLKEIHALELEQIKKGKYCPDWWTDIPSGSHISKNERTGYPTQKPRALLERIILAASNEGDIVLDPFCGSATTCVAAEKLNRKWIGVDVSEDTFRHVKRRLRNEVYSLGAGRVRGNEPAFSAVPPVRDE